MLELDFDFFNNDWDILQIFLARKGNPPYVITGNLDLSNSVIDFLGNLQSVEGDFNLYETKIDSLENLQSVGGFLNLYDSEIQSLGTLKSVGGDLVLRNTPLSKMVTKEEIRNQVEIGGDLYL